jgi:hypothetical protein
MDLRKHEIYDMNNNNNNNKMLGTMKVAVSFSAIHETVYSI